MMKLALTLLVLGGALVGQRGGFTSSDIADAAERLTARRAHAGLELRRLSGTALRGPALTMRVVPDDTASSMGEGLKAIRALETAAPGTVIVVSIEGDKSFAVFGATFATLARSRRLAGFVVDGAMRGLADFIELDVPMFARGTVAGSAGGHFRLDAINVPVTCAGVEIAPDDYVVGDADGIAVAPRGRYADIVGLATKLRLEKTSLLPLIMRYGSYTRAVEAQTKKKGSPAP